MTGLPCLSPDWPAPAAVQALCTTRDGGVSLAPYDSLNLGDHVQDAPLAVQTNRRLLQQHCAAHPVFLQQVHGCAVVPINRQTPDGTVADACWTTEASVACTIQVADCLPVLFTDRQGRAVAAAHAGWRGLAGGVLEATVQSLCAAADCAPDAVMAWLGPCIGPSAFEVGDDVRLAFQHAAADAWPAQMTSFQPGLQPGKWWTDLAGLARMRLAQAGVTQCHGNDSSAAWCTVTQASRFFSYRRDGRTGRFAACIWRTA
jgi:YfiH family protein